MTNKLPLVLLATALLSGSAFAQTNAPATSAPGATAPRAASGADAKQPMFQMHQGQWRSSKLIGVDVYNNNNDKIGDVNELILGQDGRIEAVVIGVGGFLGMGEHDVAVPFNQVRFTDEARRTAATGSTAGTANTTNTTAPAGSAAGGAPNAPMAGGTAATQQGTSANRPANTNIAGGDAYRGYPDHAVVNMTKDQLQALPQVRYAR